MGKEIRNELNEIRYKCKNENKSSKKTNRCITSSKSVNDKGDSDDTTAKGKEEQAVRDVKDSSRGKDDYKATLTDDSNTLIGDEFKFSNPLPKVVHYERQTGNFDEQTLVNNEPMNGEPARAITSISMGSNSNMEAVKARISQMQYNHNRVALDRSINSAARIIQELRRENHNHHIFYPISRDSRLDIRLNSKDSRIAIMRQKSLSCEDINFHIEKASNFSEEDSSNYTGEPLVTENEFEILQLNYRADHGSDDVVGSLDDNSIANLLDEKIAQILRHLTSLKDRIDDTSSKVLVTGDLNSGKSAFCNALLRRSVLPEDQEPCTSVFCEIIDCLEND